MRINRDALLRTFETTLFPRFLGLLLFGYGVASNLDGFQSIVAFFSGAFLLAVTGLRRNREIDLSHD